MALVVQKFGGTSVADPDRIRAVADHVARTKRKGDDVIVVVSAMGKETDELIRLANDVSTTQPGREMDMLLTVGERKAMALLCMALHDLGIDADSFTGSQAGIITDTEHTRAKIVDVRPDRIRECLKAGKVAVVAGFQGMSTDREITTFGRGGSDNTAVALAYSLGGDSFEKYSDVPGIFSADPRVVPDARRLSILSTEEMLEIAATGSGVLMFRAVEFARNHGIRIHVRSSFSWEPGTWVVPEAELPGLAEGRNDDMEQPIIAAVTHDTSEAKITVARVPDRPGIAARLFRTLADKQVNLDMIVQNVSHDGTTDISFTVPKTDLQSALDACESHRDEFGAAEVIADDTIAKVSVVGAGMKSHPGVSATMFETLATNEINIEMISTSPIRITCVVRLEKVEDAVQCLHKAFDLGAS
jgi:aspartate kinase